MQRTVMEILERTARDHGDLDAMSFKSDGAWEKISWSEYHQRVLRVGRAFMTLGVEPGDGVVIMAFNRPEWFLADVGAICAGGLPAGIYTTCTTEQCHYIANHCDAVVAVLEDPSYLDRFLTIRDRLPKLKSIVLMEGDSGTDGVLSWNQLLAATESTPIARLESRIESQQPEDACTLIYTSGTTGVPKAVALSHANIDWVGQKLGDTYQIGAGDSVLSYLPLSHIAEQIISLHTPMMLGACSWFAESLEALGENLREVRPQFFFGVPRVWEKIQARIEAVGAQNTGLKKKIAAWARRTGLAAGYADQAGKRRPLLYPLADKLVFSKVRERLGLDRARFCATSAAPISLHTLEFFLSLGIPILEVYGMSECTGPATFSELQRYRTGSAGFAIEGSELRTADDGEILMRGPHVFLGYHKDEAATREMVDEKGWLHSGDIGEIDSEGFLRVTDRKKELIITSGGKNIAPQLIEGKLKAIRGIDQAVVIGDRRKYLAALLVVDPESIARVAKAVGSPAGDAIAAATCPIFEKYVSESVEQVNETLASFETVKKFALLPETFTPEGGELTPTMKLKRRVVDSKYGDLIESLYRD